MMHPNMEDFQRFCEAKPPERSYQWNDSDICACGQFATVLKVRNWTHIGGLEGKFWQLANEIAGEYPRNFGALAQRVERYRRDRSPEPDSRMLAPFPQPVRVLRRRMLSFDGAI